MKYILILSIIAFSLACNPSARPKQQNLNFTSIEIHPILENADLSIRAMEIDKSGVLIYSANQGNYGLYDTKADILKQHELNDSTAQKMEFRGIAPSQLGINFISAGSPALVYKLSYTDWQAKLVYKDESEAVFFDAMQFWNEQEGIAFGDAMNGCMSVLITRDGGHTWKQLDCDDFPAAYEGEGAFAASNTNIAIHGEKAWLASKSKVYYSADKGESWSVIKTPIIAEKETQGIYSLDFYDENNGIAIGGDYTEADSNTDNLIRTQDGGQTWQVISSENSPGYRSCIQFIPNTNAKGLLAVGYKGINRSMDGGLTWQTLSEEGFYTARFINANSGYLAGKGRIAKFTLR